MADPSVVHPGYRDPWDDDDPWRERDEQREEEYREAVWEAACDANRAESEQPGDADR